MNNLNEVFVQLSNYIKNDNNYFKIENWNNFKLDFSSNFENKEPIIARIKLEIGDVVGIYAIYHENICLYIGIGRPIWYRIKSHYYASQGKVSAPKWVRFFSENKKVLKVYWKEFRVFENSKVDDCARLLIESILIERYDPEFEKKLFNNIRILYSTKGPSFPTIF